MTKRTIANRLKSYVQKVNSEQRRTSWYDNREDHPLPTLPNVEILESIYLPRVEASTPQAVEGVKAGIEVVKNVREGKIKYRGRGGPEY